MFEHGYLTDKLPLFQLKEGRMAVIDYKHVKQIICIIFRHDENCVLFEKNENDHNLTR